MTCTLKVEIVLSFETLATAYCFTRRLTLKDCVPSQREPETYIISMILSSGGICYLKSLKLRLPFEIRSFEKNIYFLHHF
jgi:hypothetical protein